MSSFENLFGSTLVSKNGQIKTSTALSGKGAVMVYFSAHWCPPCRGFTPVLSKFYTQNSQAKNFEIIFASSDKTQEDFDSYYGEMPWLALPFGSDFKKNLSSKYQIKGIPSLVVLDNQGEVITLKGRDGVAADPKAEQFPWTPKSFSQTVAGTLLKNVSGEKTEYSSLEGKTIGFYFSAHWCPPCKRFTPLLAKFYNQNKDRKNFEIIFATNDRDEDSFKEYYGEMPWLAFPFGDQRISELSDLYEVEGIPCLVFVTHDGKVLTKEAVGDVHEDPEAKDFPWIPKPVVALTNTVGGRLNDSTSLIVHYKTKEEAEAAIPKLEELLVQNPTCNDNEKLLIIVTSAAEDAYSQMRDKIYSFVNLDAKKPPSLLLISIPTGQKFVSLSEPSVDAIRDILLLYRSKKVTYVGLRD